MSVDISDSALVNAHDLAATLKVSRRTLWRLRNAGRLPFPIRLGGSVRWRASDIQTWIAAGCPCNPATSGPRKKR